MRVLQCARTECVGNKTRKTTWNTRSTISWWHSPITTFSHDFSGGTLLTVDGDNLDSVAEPRLTITGVVYTGSSRSLSSSVEFESSVKLCVIIMKIKSNSLLIGFCFKATHAYIQELMSCCTYNNRCQVQQINFTLICWTQTFCLLSPDLHGAVA